MATVPSPEARRQPLAEVMNFSAADLEANHAGRLSDSQKARLLASWRVTRTAAIGAGIVIGLSATAFLFFGGQAGSPVLTVVGAGLTVANAGVVGLAANNYLRVQRDVRHGAVAVLAGTAKRIVRVGRGNPVYIVAIGGEQINVTREVFNAFEEEADYRLYRAPLTRALFTAERG